MTAAGEVHLVLLAMCLSALVPFCSSAYTREQIKPSSKTGWFPPLAAPMSVDVGRRSSLILPLYGNVYPSGSYYASLSIGDPPKPYFLDVDTGSELTWLQCDAPCISCSKGPHPLYKPTKDKLVPCEQPVCAAVQASASPGNHHPGANQHQRCDSPNDQCDYEVEYADHGSSRGVLISDAFSIRFVNGSLFRPRLAFGCGYDQQLRPGSPSPTDGVLGLGSGGSTIISQLREQGAIRNVLGHCLSQKGGGFLFFGDDLVPRSGITWTPMSRRLSPKYYSPGPVNVFSGGNLVGKNVQMILDSGSSYTYFSSQLYGALLLMLQKDLSGKPLNVVPEEHSLPRCWKGTKPFKFVADVSSYFKPLTLIFGQRKRAAQLDISPGGYLVITKSGNVCLGILNGTEAGLKDFNIVGDISLQDHVVIYDNEKEQIGWARANCNISPNADRDDGFAGDPCPAQFASAGGVLAPEFAAPDISWTT